MNITQVIQDAFRGRAPRPRERQSGALDTSPAAEFLRTEVWPLLKEARAALEARNYVAVALQPHEDDEAHRYTLLILDSSCQAAEEASFLHFLVQDRQVHVRVKHPKRSDEKPVLLNPSGSILLIRDVIEDFVYQCLEPRGRNVKALPVEELRHAEERSLTGISRLSTAH